MIIRESEAVWHGTLREGSGRLRLGSGVFEGAYSFPSRFDNAPGTNPEELIAAAHAGCFMALTYALGTAGPTITRVALETEGAVPGLSEGAFRAFADAAKTSCLVSRALAGVLDIAVEATLSAHIA